MCELLSLEYLSRPLEPFGCDASSIDFYGSPKRVVGHTVLYRSSGLWKTLNAQSDFRMAVSSFRLEVPAHVFFLFRTDVCQDYQFFSLAASGASSSMRWCGHGSLNEVFGTQEGGDVKLV